MTLLHVYWQRPFYSVHEHHIANGTADNFHWPRISTWLPKLKQQQQHKKKDLFDKKLQSRSVTAHVR